MYIMSCSEVMYQAYYPYLYQRAGASAHPVPRTGPFSSPFTAAHQYDRFNVQRLPDAHSLSQASSSSVGGPGSLAASGLDVTGHSHALYLQGSAHSSGGSVSSAGGGSPTSPLRPQKEEDCSLHGRSSTEDPHGGVDEDDSQEASNSRAQYVSANCVVFTHYQGDAASVVDEHFSRALDKTTTHAKESSPMSSRNFPPSFWNSQHYAGASGSSAHGHTSASAADLYPEHYHPSDAWYQYSQHHYHHNMAAAAQYGSLLLPGGRLHHAPCKAMDWQHPGIDSPYSSYPTMSGLEAQVQDSSKDLYWF